MQTKVNKQEVDLVLKNILHTLGLQSNLISIPKICAQGLNVNFGLNTVAVQFSNGDTAVEGVRKNGLYLINIPKTPQVFLTKSTKKPIPMDIWH